MNKINKESLKHICRIGKEWFWSNIFYDAENDQFLEERYHEEYLDVETVFDGWFPISDQDLWVQLQKESNATGISEYLKIRTVAPSHLN
jgi:hypothetical protein